MRGIAIREELTDEWKNRDVKEETEYLENCAKTSLEKALNKDGTQLNRLVLQSVPLALQRRVMRRFLCNISPKNPDFEHIEALTTLINAPRRSRIASLPGNLIAEVQENWIIFIKKETKNRDAND